MIKNLVFDMGGVLIEWQPMAFLSALTQNEEEAKRCYEVLFTQELWAQLDDGTAKEEAVILQACERLPASLWPVIRSFVGGWWHRFLRPIAGMGQLLAEYRERGYRLYLLSNVSETVHDYFARIPGADCFTGLCISAEERLAKPNPALFLRLCEKFSLSCSESVFIDDRTDNVEAAQGCGFYGIVFSGEADALHSALEKLLSEQVGKSC